MELVEGDDLSQRIARGAIPLDEALPIAKQIAEALEGAHEQGIIHRDLKPANIKVRLDGTVKVLDFGLAKAVAPVGGAPDVSQSPTITTPAMTQAGMILGTAAYMSLEQAKGRPADKRSDVWAFGCVLYEMLTGKRVFEGEDVGDTLAAVLRSQPDWNALPAEAPFPVRTLLRGCLEKNPRQRIADISAALFVLRHQATGAAIEGSASASVAAAAAKQVGRQNVRRVALFTTAALMLGAGMTGTGVWWLTRPASPSVVRMTIATSGSAALRLSGVGRDVAITPDGSRVVYRGDNQLLVRALNQLEPTVLSGLGTLLGVFISPEGQRVGFFDVVTMKKVAITGGPPVTIARLDSPPRGATWMPDDTIVFATSNVATGLQRVSAAGGPPEVLTRPDHTRGEADHLWPEIRPGGRAVLFTILAQTGGLDAAQVAVLDLRTNTQKILVGGGSHAHYVQSGHLVYTVAGTLRAVPFDLNRLEIRGTTAPVVPRVVTTDTGAGNFAVAANGTLVYVDAPGRFEIFVRSFPNAGGQWQVSTGGGRTPLWARNGEELFYLGLDGALLRVGVEASGATWNAGTPTKLLEARYFTGGSRSAGQPYDVSPDGQRFLMIKVPTTDAAATPPTLVVVQHWEQEMKRLLPTR